jgi:hypothetical protein
MSNKHKVNLTKETINLSLLQKVSSNIKKTIKELSSINSNDIDNHTLFDKISNAIENIAYTKTDAYLEENTNVRTI